MLLFFLRNSPFSEGITENNIYSIGSFDSFREFIRHSLSTFIFYETSMRLSATVLCTENLSANSSTVICLSFNLAIFKSSLKSFDGGLHCCLSPWPNFWYQQRYVLGRYDMYWVLSRTPHK